MAGYENPYTVCAVVLATVQSALDARGRGVAEAVVAVGGIVVDDCCAGLLAVAPERVFLTADPFPTELAANLSPCVAAPVAVDLVVGLYRCIPVLDATGTRAPAAGDVEAVAAEILADAATVWRALSSRELLGDDPMDPGEPLWQIANLSQIPVPAEGGCVGIETRLTLGVGQYGWCVES